MKTKNLLTFTPVLVVLTLAIALIAPFIAQPSFMILILSVLALITWLIYFFLTRQSRQNFVRSYLLTIVLKLIFLSVFICVLLFLDKPNANANTIFFVTAYILFTTVEVVFLFRRMR